MWIVVILALIVNLVSLSRGMLKDISFKLVENCSIGTIVGNIRLSADLYVFKNVELRLENSDYFEENHLLSLNRFGKSLKDLFKINNATGDLVTIADIDRERLCDSNLLKRNENCTILQIVSVNKLMWININIEILDINDNPPAFRLNYLRLTISEITKLQTTLTIEEPSDLDSDQFQPIRYFIVNELRTSLPFTLVQNPLKLVLLKPLDYESVKLYKVIIVACDNGKPALCGNQTIEISVTNENDESPMFLRSNYTAIIHEDTPVGQVILWPTAFDKDDGDYGKLEYSFSSGFDEAKRYFSIDKNSGKIIIIKRFNSPTKFKFSIKAVDKAPNPLIGRAWIILHVVDVNNHNPVILVNPIDSFLVSKFQNHTIIEIIENNKIPLQLAFITVSDLDQGENARCSCQIQPVTNESDLKYFKLINVIEMSERSIYKLLADKSFNAEESKYFSILVVCSDHGEPQNVARTQIEIYIKDENEYPPTFDQNIYEIYIKENSAAGSIVKTVQIFDRDLTQSNTFDLTSPGSTFFSINSTGVIYTKVVLDYEKQQKLSFQVLAINRGIKSFTSSARVLVMVLDVNDNTPEFSAAQNKFDVLENMKGRYVIGKIEAFDKDSGINSKLNYYLLNATSESSPKIHHLQTFDLNGETGVISSNVSLDYEECDLYVITVKIVDNGQPRLTNVQTFHIHIIDANDNGPVWQYPNLRDNIMNISIQNIRDSVLTRVRAVDNDSDRYNVVNYYLLSHNDIFAINQLTGVITFKSLNVKPGQMTLHLQAVDANSRTVHSSQILIVYIMDDDRSFLQISLSSSLTFPVMICIIGISSLISIILVIFVFYFCYRKRCVNRNCSRSAGINNNCRSEEKLSDIKFHKDPKKTIDIPLDLVTDNDAFNQNLIEDSMKLILDPHYNTSTSSANSFHRHDSNPKLQSLFCKLQADDMYQNLIRQGYTSEYHDQKQGIFGLTTSIAGSQSSVRVHNDSCLLHSVSGQEREPHFDKSKSRSLKLKALEKNESLLDSYATFTNCRCTNVATSDYESSSPLNKSTTAPFIFNGSAWIPNMTLTNENQVVQNKNLLNPQPLKSIMKKTQASFINIDSSSSSGQCNDTDQGSSTHDSGCIVGYLDSGCLPPKSISLLDNTYQCKKSQV